MPDRRLHHLAQDRVGRRLGDLLDLHAALRRGHDHDALALPVEHQADVELALDRHRLLDVEPVHHASLGAGLVRHQPLAQQRLRRLAYLILGAADLHAARLAPRAGMDLRLHRPAIAADLGGAIHRLLRAVRHAAPRDGDAEAGEKFLGLVFVDVHWRPPWVRCLKASQCMRERRSARYGLPAALTLTPHAFASGRPPLADLRRSAPARPRRVDHPSVELRRAASRGAASSSAARMRRARSTSAGGGGNTPLASGHLRRMDRPLALDAESRVPPSRCTVPLGILEVAEWAVDRRAGHRPGRPPSSARARSATGRPDSRG